MKIEFPLHEAVGVIEGGKLRLVVRPARVEDRTTNELELIVANGSQVQELIADVQRRWRALVEGYADENGV